jgi:hypothetical protein
MQESAYQSRPYHGKSYQAANGRQHYIHPNDQVVPMEIDPPVTTYIRRTSTEADKQRLREQGKCFRCEAFGHMAQECPLKPCQQAPSTYGQRPSQSGQRPRAPRTGQFKRKPFSQSQPKRGFRKSNKPRTPSYTPWARAAYIEEVEEGEDDEASDASASRDGEVPDLAARTARLSEDQREQWIKEMNAMGINF